MSYGKGVVWYIYKIFPISISELKNYITESGGVCALQCSGSKKLRRQLAISCAENIKAISHDGSAGRRFYFCRLFVAAKLGAAGENWLISRHTAPQR